MPINLYESNRRVQLLDCGGRVLDLSTPQVMAIVNVTPDSFSDGGRFADASGLKLDKVLRSVEAMLSAGAAIIDIGGESTRPGAASVTLLEEIDRVLPVVEAVSTRFDTIVSVDTSRSDVMRQAASLGAGLINDVRALEFADAVSVAAEIGLPVCLMHMQGNPEFMQKNPHYNNVIDEVMGYLEARINACLAAGIAREKIIIDPGFGFGKTTEHNLQLLKNLSVLQGLACPVLVGLSRKSLIGQVLGREVDQRLAGSLALAMMAAIQGASIIRVHDVAQTVDVLALLKAVAASDTPK